MWQRRGGWGCASHFVVEDTLREGVNGLPDHKQMHSSAGHHQPGLRTSEMLTTVCILFSPGLAQCVFADLDKRLGQKP